MLYSLVLFYVYIAKIYKTKINIIILKYYKNITKIFDLQKIYVIINIVVNNNNIHKHLYKVIFAYFKITQLFLNFT